MLPFINTVSVLFYVRTSCKILSILWQTPFKERKPCKVYHIKSMFLLQGLQFLKVVLFAKVLLSQREYRVRETYCYRSLAVSFSLIAINFNYEKPKKENF